LKRPEVNLRAPAAGCGARADRRFCLIPRQCGRLIPFIVGQLPVNVYLTLGICALLALLIIAVGWALLLRRRQLHRGSSLQNLVELADQLEADLKTCRSGLQQAHAVMSLNPDLPAASEQDARHAIDGGLRALLQQRLWIRDRSAQASQRELDEAAASMRRTRARLQPLLQALTQAQIDLNSAMRDHIRRESDT
jgi:hypothetical protein